MSLTGTTLWIRAPQPVRSGIHSSEAECGNSLQWERSKNGNKRHFAVAVMQLVSVRMDGLQFGLVLVIHPSAQEPTWKQRLNLDKLMFRIRS